MTTVTRVQLSTWTNKCRGNSIGFLLRNMDAVSLSLGGIHTGPKLHSVLRGQITTQPKVMKLLSWHIQCSLNSEWAAGGSLVQHEKPPLQLHQVGAGNPPRDALGRLWHPRTRGKPAERHPDGYLHDAEDFWTVSIWHSLTLSPWCSQATGVGDLCIDRLGSGHRWIPWTFHWILMFRLLWLFMSILWYNL